MFRPHHNDSFDGLYIVSGGRNSTLKFWNSDTSELERKVQSCHNIFHILDVAKVSKNLIVTAGEDCHVNLYDVDKMKLLKRVRSHDDYVKRVKFSRSLKLLLSCSTDTKICSYGPQTNFDSRHIFEDEENGHCDTVHDIEFFSRSKRFVSCDSESKILQWDLEIGKLMGKFIDRNEEIEGDVYCLKRFNRNMIVSGGDDHCVRIWDVRMKDTVRRIYNKGNVTCMDIDKVNNLLFVGGESGNVTVYDCRSSIIPLFWFDCHEIEMGIERVRVIPEKECFVTCSVDETIVITKYDTNSTDCDHEQITLDAKEEVFSIELLQTQLPYGETMYAIEKNDPREMGRMKLPEIKWRED